MGVKKMGAIKVDRDERGELFKLVLNEVLDNIPSSKLAELLFEKWGKKEVKDFAYSLVFEADLLIDKEDSEKYRQRYGCLNLAQKAMQTFLPATAKKELDGSDQS